MTHCTRSLALLATLSLLAACGSQPIPLTAQSGTTFVLMIPKHVVPGFGRGWSGADPGTYPPTGPALRDWGSPDPRRPWLPH